MSARTSAFGLYISAGTLHKQACGSTGGTTLRCTHRLIPIGVRSSSARYTWVLRWSLSFGLRWRDREPVSLRGRLFQPLILSLVSELTVWTNHAVPRTSEVQT